MCIVVIVIVNVITKTSEADSALLPVIRQCVFDWVCFVSVVYVSVVCGCLPQGHLVVSFAVLHCTTLW